MVQKIEEHTKSYEIKQISFSVLTPAQIRGMSVVNVGSKMLYDIGTRRPCPNGPLDLRLGVSTKAGTCETCGESLQKCSGHFGHIDLPLPVYHIGFLKTIVHVLGCVCKSCGALLLGFNRKLGYAARMQIESIRNECKKTKTCPRCARANGVIRKNNAFRIVHELRTGKSVQAVEINPQTCLNIFSLIEEEDYAYLGLTHSPCAFIIQSLPVPPACIRPSVDMQEDGFNEDDLTVKLSEIVNTCLGLEESIAKGNALTIVNDDWDLLQLQVSLFINSDLPSVSMQHTPIRGLVQRLKGKQGRFRCNLSGKRVDFTGRTVISPDPNLSVEQVGIPVHMAKVLTIPERVTSFNIGWLQGLVGNGMSYPGANYVISRDKDGAEFKRFLMYGKCPVLRVGDVVERHLLDDDVLLFNRQPSLHRMSIMAHRAKVHQHKTLRFNECDCASYNADFDGDEMNIHVPQTLEARAEAIQLMGIRNNICTARNGEPLISCTQDFLTGTYLLTARNVFFTRERFAQLCAYTNMPGRRIRARPVILAPVELFTGKQLYEHIVACALAHCAGTGRAPVVNLSARNRSYKSDDHQNEGHVLIRNNRFLKGRLDKAVIGGENRKGSLIYQLLRCSKGCAVAAMNSISRLSVRFLAERGFSIGLDDVYPSENLIAEKNRIVETGFRKVQGLIDGTGEEKPNDAAELEMNISMILSKIRDDCGNVCIDELSTSNSPVVMQECGSKGSKINVSQMIACVGQQIISGHRIPNGMQDRTLPHFDSNSLQPASKGFVLNSFFTGMHSYEFFFHAVSGREGLVDTAVKTAETGYMQRRLMKALEDLSVMYDHTVRNSFNDLVQFKYGEDNMEPLRNEAEESLEWAFTAAVSRVHTEAAGADPADATAYDSFALCHCDDLDFAACLRDFFGLAEGRSAPDTRANAAAMAALDGVFGLVRSAALTSDLVGERYARELVKFAETHSARKYFHRGSCLEYFKNIQFVTEFAIILGNRITESVVEPGTAVGAIAGQSIGEPGTQMTLKTFHFAGVASMNITLGVPRLKEIINAAVNINTPLVNGKLSATSLESARVVKGRLERVLFKDIVKRITHTISADGSVLLFEVDTALMGRMRLEASLADIAASISRTLKTVAVDVTGNAVRHTVKRLKENSIFAKEKTKKQILNCMVCGLDTVSRVVLNRLKDAQSGGGPGYDLLIEGCGLGRILGVPGIEPYHTRSNNVMEVMTVLGIEAARNLIISEVEYTMGKHGIKIDHRHVMLLADMMCFKGEVLGITRFGIGKMRASTLMLASFEQTADYLFSAAAQGKVEKIEGVSESIIMGVPISLGTGLVQLLWKE
ncbi:DNA-directed RNA polymerase III subunit RPC1 [Pancytospora philotis]|nr:DNA-directed RNA polymerase III subunit RPC1 [Pancytospora philotis]